MTRRISSRTIRQRRAARKEALQIVGLVIGFIALLPILPIVGFMFAGQAAFDSPLPKAYFALISSIL